MGFLSRIDFLSRLGSWALRTDSESNFRYVFTESGARFYVAQDEKTRSKLFDRSRSDRRGVASLCEAFTVGSDVYVRAPWYLTRNVILHELEHVKQWRKYGILFNVMYIWANRDGYWNNKYEHEARAASVRGGGGAKP